MKILNLKKMIMIGIFTILALTAVEVAFGQSKGKIIRTRDGWVFDDSVKKEIQKFRGLEIHGPGALFTGEKQKYGFAFRKQIVIIRRDLVKGATVGIIYVEAGSKRIPNGYYSVELKQFGTDEKGNPTYGINLFNASGVQALSIGAKTNGAAGNTNGLGAKKTERVTAQGDDKCPQCGVMMPVFTKRGDVETLSINGLDTQIVEAVAYEAKLKSAD